jgi:hypothetical protein
MNTTRLRTLNFELGHPPARPISFGWRGAMKKQRKADGEFATSPKSSIALANPLILLNKPAPLGSVTISMA